SLHMKPLLHPLLALLFFAACERTTTQPQLRPPGPPSVRVQGNQLVDASGHPVRLRGVDRSGTEYACAQGWGIFDGPSDSASVQAIASWNANAVRVPLNETCWLGLNGGRAHYLGSNYQRAIADFVTLFNRAGLVVILDLHWSAAGTAIALGQAPIPDRDHTPDLGGEVVAAYRVNKGVVFTLINEPFPDNNADT